MLYGECIRWMHANGAEHFVFFFAVINFISGTTLTCVKSIVGKSSARSFTHRPDSRRVDLVDALPLRARNRIDRMLKSIDIHIRADRPIVSDFSTNSSTCKGAITLDLLALTTANGSSSATNGAWGTSEMARSATDYKLTVRRQRHPIRFALANKLLIKPNYSFRCSTADGQT